MWLIIREKDSAVLGTNYNCAPPAPPGCVVKEWHGAEPIVHSPRDGVESWDPTVGLSSDDSRLSSKIDKLKKRVKKLENDLKEMNKGESYG